VFAKSWRRAHAQRRGGQSNRRGLVRECTEQRVVDKLQELARAQLRVALDGVRGKLHHAGADTRSLQPRHQRIGI
jgi:hypothetical protein